MAKIEIEDASNSGEHAVLLADNNQGPVYYRNGRPYAKRVYTLLSVVADRSSAFGHRYVEVSSFDTPEDAAAEARTLTAAWQLHDFTVPAYYAMANTVYLH